MLKYHSSLKGSDAGPKMRRRSDPFRCMRHSCAGSRCGRPPISTRRIQFQNCSSTGAGWLQSRDAATARWAYGVLRGMGALVAPYSQTPFCTFLSVSRKAQTFRAIWTLLHDTVLTCQPCTWQVQGWGPHDIRRQPLWGPACRASSPREGQPHFSSTLTPNPQPHPTEPNNQTCRYVQ